MDYESFIQAVLYDKTGKGDPELARTLGTALKDADDIRDQLDRLASVRAGAVAGHAKRLEELDRELALVRSRCPHQLTTYHRDPSGGSDGWRECQICGLEDK